MFASEEKLLVSCTPEEAKQYTKAWSDLGLGTATFTSDDKKLVIVVGWGGVSEVAEASEFTPSVKPTKKEAANG